MSAQSPRPTDSDGLSRRSLLRRGGTIAGGAAVTTTVGSRTVPKFAPVGRAQAIAPAIPIGVLAGAAGVKYLTGESVGEHAINLFTGDGRDYSGYTGADALHQEIVIGATEMQSADERVMTSISNNIQNSENVALAKGKAAIIEEMNAGNPESNANTAMEDAIDDYYATIQTNILNHWGAQVDQSMHMMSRVESHSDLSLSNVFRSQTESGSTENVDSVQSMTSYDLQLLNGDEMTVNALQIKRSGSTSRELTPPTTETQKADLGVTNPSDDGVIYHFERSRYVDAWDEISAARDQVYSDLSGFVSDVYAQYEPGDIPTEDLVDPITAATELRQDYDNMAGAGAHAAMLGIPTTAEFSALLHIYSADLEGEDDGEDYYDVWCDLFTDHVPTNDQDEEIGFEVGSTYQPSDWDEPLYIAYEYVDEQTGVRRSDFTQIESEFSIESVEDSDGNEVENFQTRNRNNQTSDVEELKNELEQLREEQIAMQEEAEEEDGGGGIGDWFGGGDSQGGMIIGALVVIGGVVGIGQLTG